MYFRATKKLTIESEAQLGEVIGRGKTAVKEYGQWWWIDDWEKLAEDKLEETTQDYKAALESLLKHYPGYDEAQKGLEKTRLKTLLDSLDTWKKKKNRKDEEDEEDESGGQRK